MHQGCSNAFGILIIIAGVGAFVSLLNGEDPGWIGLGCMFVDVFIVVYIYAYFKDQKIAYERFRESFKTRKEHEARIKDIRQKIIIKKDISYKVYEEEGKHYYELMTSATSAPRWSISKNVINQLKENELPYNLKLIWIDCGGFMLDEEKIDMLIEKHSDAVNSSFVVSKIDVEKCFEDIKWDSRLEDYLS